MVETRGFGRLQRFADVEQQTRQSWLQAIRDKTAASRSRGLGSGLGACRGLGSGLSFFTTEGYPPVMSRPLRLEFEGAIYHVTSRGDRREAIYRDDEDRGAQLNVIAQAMARFDAQVLAYCQMGNHYHLVLHTRQANLSRTMRHVNGVYTQAFNRRHSLVGHLFQGRFKAILVDREAHLLALCRYVERNPVAAGLVQEPGAWAWSSYRAHVCLAAAPEWLDADGLHGYLLGREVRTERDRTQAARKYAAFVNEVNANDRGIWSAGLRQQVFLGDEAFVQSALARATSAQRAEAEVPKAQRSVPVRKTLQAYLAQHANQADALTAAYREGGLTMSAIAKALGMSVPTVSRRIASSEMRGCGG
jgi:putative transposase